MNGLIYLCKEETYPILKLLYVIKIIIIKRQFYYVLIYRLEIIYIICNRYLSNKEIQL